MNASVAEEPLLALDLSQKSSVFGRYEHFNLILPVIFLLACVIVAYLESISGAAEGQSKQNIKALIALLGFNSTHTLFTFFICTIVPETRQYIQESWSRKEAWVFIFIGLVVILPLVQLVRLNHWLNEWSEIGVLIVTLILFLQHAIKQTFGLSALYSKQGHLELSEADKHLVQKLQRKESFYFRPLIVLAGVLLTSRFIPQIFTATQIKIFSSLTLLPVIMIFHTVFQYPGKSWTYKKVFLIRLFLYPLIGYSWLAAPALGALHGIEYVSLTLNMLQHSKTKNKQFYSWIMLVSGILMMIPYAIWLAPNLIPHVHLLSDHMLNGIIVTCFTITYLHYFLDGILFRIRNPHVRKALGPLLGL